MKSTQPAIISIRCTAVLGKMACTVILVTWQAVGKNLDGFVLKPRYYVSQFTCEHALHPIYSSCCAVSRSNEKQLQFVIIIGLPKICKLFVILVFGARYPVTLSPRLRRASLSTVRQSKPIIAFVYC